MNTIKLKNTWFDIIDDGIQNYENFLKITLVLGETTIDQLEALLDPLPETVDIYDELHETLIAIYEGYSRLVSLEKCFIDGTAVIILSSPTVEDLFKILMGEI